MLKKYCTGKYKVGLWGCPPFIFLIMGAVTIISIIASYWVGRIYADPAGVIVIVCVVTAVLFILSHIIVASFERISKTVQEKSEFLGIMSHQLRAPLAAIKWHLSSVMQKDETLSIIEEQNDRMTRMVNDLLEVQRLDNNVAFFKNTDFSLPDLVKEIIAKYPGVDISFSAPGKDLIVCADRSKISHAISHLLDNAVRYSQDEKKIEIALEKLNSDVRFLIKDEGVGISEKDFGNVFKKFFRGNISKKHKTDGLGLGLFVVKAIVEHCGGRVDFSSIEGKGSTFWFELPLTK